MTNTQMLQAIKEGFNTTERLTTGMDGYTRQRAMNQINDLRLTGYIATDLVNGKDGKQHIVYVVTKKGDEWIEADKSLEKGQP